MALQKTLVKDNGTSGNYWRIERFIDDRNAGKTTIYISLYKDKAFSDALKAAPEQNVLTKTFTDRAIAIKSINVDLLLASTIDAKIAAAYEAVKTNAFFADAVNV